MPRATLTSTRAPASKGMGKGVTFAIRKRPAFKPLRPALRSSRTNWSAAVEL